MVQQQPVQSQLVEPFHDPLLSHQQIGPVHPHPEPVTNTAHYVTSNDDGIVKVDAMP
jgi:hypothetical protein